MKRLLQITLLLAGLAWCVPAHGITWTGGTGSSGVGTPRTCSLSVSAGDSVFVAVLSDPTAATSVAVTDNASGGTNTYTVTATSPATNGGKAFLYHSLNIAKASTTISAAYTGGTGSNTIFCGKVDGASFGAGTLHDNKAGTGTSATPTTTAITDTAGDVMFGACFDGGTITSATSPWTINDIVRNGEASERIASSAGGTQAVLFASGSSTYACVGASFTPAAAATAHTMPPAVY